MNESIEPRTRVELRIRGRIPTGQPVAVTVRLMNIGLEPVELYLRGREITLDLEVTRSDGRPVWSRLEGQVVQAILALRTLEPQEVIELSAEWDQRDGGGSLVGPGSYTMVARILTDGTMRLESPPVSFQVDRT